MTTALAMLEAQVNAIKQWTDGAHATLADHAQRIDELKGKSIINEDACQQNTNDVYEAARRLAESSKDMAQQRLDIGMMQ